MGTPENLYQFRSIIRTSNVELDENDQAFIASFPLMMMQASEATFAELFLKCLINHPRFNTAGRVSLVKRVGLANQIEVVSSANTDPEMNNLMGPGYSCFIDAKGSFFRLSPGTIRIFQKASDVVEQFQLENRPPQRSILRIAKMGFDSGIVIPLYDSDIYLHGALFINFFGSMPFESKDSDYFLLSFMESQANMLLYQNRSTLAVARSLPESHWVGQVFNPDIFRQALEKMGFSADIRIDNRQTERFLVSPGNLAVFFGNLALFVEQKNLVVDLRVDTQKHQVLFTILGLQVSKTVQPLIDHLAAAVGLSCSYDKIGLKVHLTLESIEDNQISYSIETGDGASSFAPTTSSLRVGQRPQVESQKPEWERGDPSDLMQVIYVSYLAGNHDPEMLEGLSQKIVSNNKNNSVTGILFYHGGVFIEVLEGLRKDMAVLMPKIEKDPRHSGFQLIHCGKTKERSFDNFSWKLDAASSVDVHFFNEILKLKSENSQQDVSRWMNLITKVAS